jgi:hypothetical protein
MGTIEELVDFIKVAHAGQVDKGAQAPYWEHPFAVMNALPPFAYDELKKAALLHDAIEDTAFKRQGDRLVFSEEKFALLSPKMQQAKRPAEIARAEARGEIDPQNTAPILESPLLSSHILNIVEGVTNDEFVMPDGLNEEQQRQLSLDHYQQHIVALANDRPEDPEALRLAEDRVLLKFTDMSQNVDKARLSELTDKSRLTWFADKYGKPFNALLERAKEIAEKYGYELVAETTLEDDGQGNRRFYLTQPQEWHLKDKVSDRADGALWSDSLGSRTGRNLGE